MDALFYVLGFAICGCVLLQMVLWTSATVANLNHNRQQLEASKLLLSQQIASARQQDTNTEDLTWTGYREFYVAKLKKEAQGITSVYLKPMDNKPVPTFKSGQHLPLKFHVPGELKPPVRCYSLSTGPQNDHYRITVKAVPAPVDRPEMPAGRVSNFINSQMMVGDIVETKAPSGTFVLNSLGKSPVVLLAGGIGITPFVSMLEDLVLEGSERTIVLLYGVKCGREHAFKERIAEIAKMNRNVHIVNCYSNPEKTDRNGADYQYHGRLNIDLVKRLMPNRQCMFYLCGPPEFMRSLRTGLRHWGVPDNRIHYEAFGPATIKKTAPHSSESNRVDASIGFVRSGKRVSWSPEFECILDAAEANNVAVDSGCRAGSCKTCSVALVEGRVQYPEGMEVECETGECLPCISIPNGDVKLDV